MPVLPHRLRRKMRAAVAGILGLFLFWVIAIAALPFRRELRRSVPHVTRASDPQFERDMAGLYGSPVLSGNRIETLVNGDAIFQAMLDDINSAERSITFVSFIFKSGVLADRICEALIARAQAGVAVKLLVDWMGALLLTDDQIDNLHEGGVGLRMFRPLRPRSLWRLNNRTHRKVLVIDGKTGFIGGAGIADDWLGNARSPAEWRDTHYRVTGPIVAMLQNAFAHNWVEASGEVLQGDAFYPLLHPTGESDVQMVKSNTGSRNEIHLSLMTALAAAERHIRISTPYFVPDTVAVQQLLDARARGVQVDLLLAGKHTDSSLVRNASHLFWRELLEAGIRIHEYQPTFLHAKLIIVDDCWVSVGSANFDERSFRLNDEANLNVHDRKFVAQQIQLFDADCGQAREVELVDIAKSNWAQKLQRVAIAALRPHL